MSEHSLSCLIIRRNSVRQQKLLKVLRASYSDVHTGLVSDLRTLKVLLQRSPMVLFYFVPEDGSKDDNKAVRDEQNLLRIIQRASGDCILARVSSVSRQGLARIRPVNGPDHRDIDSCTLVTDGDISLQQQLNDLFTYARLKAEFRQCKRLLSIAEKRSQWLAEYAREAVAYIANDQHLYTNVAYLSLFGFKNFKQARQSSVSARVHADEQAIFKAVKREAERHIKPSNKLLLTLICADGSTFRAGVRFIPAVYRGQRCLQLHVQPVSNTDEQEQQQDDSVEQQASNLSNPWHESVANHRRLSAGSITQSQLASTIESVGE